MVSPHNPKIIRCYDLYLDLRYRPQHIFKLMANHSILIVMLVFLSCCLALDVQAEKVTTSRQSASNSPISLDFLLPSATAGDAFFSSEHFLGSGNCADCHNGIVNKNAKDVSIETDWSASMMANSARDPYWKATVRSELNRNPHLADAINDKCSRCHAPMANFEAKILAEPVAILDGGFLSPSHLRHDEAVEGVSCTLCHQILDSPKLGTLSGFTGQFEIGADKLLYGPYRNPFANPMVMQTGYTPTYSVHIKESRLCATCHNLKTPFVDENGQLLSTTPESEFPEQMPYSEWEHSIYATTKPKSCQQCHMPRTNGVKISSRPRWLDTRDDFAIHSFVGANKLMLGILSTNKPQLGVVSNNFSEAIRKTQTMLEKAAALRVVDHELDDDGNLSFTLKINSKTGHKLPTSYPSRRLILHVKVKDNLGNILFESGKIRANGKVVGAASDTDKTKFEPHYDVITQPDQVQIYEAVMGNNLNDVTYTLLRGMNYLKDNRLLPKGFGKQNASDDIKVVGDALADRNFIGGSDKITYRIKGLPDDWYEVEAELVYQPIAYSFAQDLFGQSGDEVRDFETMYNASRLKSTRIAALDFTVTR